LLEWTNARLLLVWDKDREVSERFKRIYSKHQIFQVNHHPKNLAQLVPVGSDRSLCGHAYTSLGDALLTNPMIAEGTNEFVCNTSFKVVRSCRSLLEGPLKQFRLIAISPWITRQHNEQSVSPQAIEEVISQLFCFLAGVNQDRAGAK